MHGNQLGQAANGSPRTAPVAGGNCTHRVRGSSGASGPPGRTLRAKKASTSGLGSRGPAILSSARNRFSCFWFLATTTVGSGGRLGRSVLGGFGAARFFPRSSAGGFGACTTTAAAPSTACGFFFGGGRL